MTIGAKICGLTTRDAVETAAECGAQYIGFVFFPGSPRNVTPKQAGMLAAGLPPTIKTVAVTVDASDALLTEIAKELGPHYLQLHGKEEVTRIAELRARYEAGIIKAVKVRNADDVAAAGKFSAVSDFLLFDAKAPDTGTFLPGGNGLSFDWRLLEGEKNFTARWFLSGGINADNVEQAVRLSGAQLLDVSSSVESAPGIKSPELIRAFMNKVASL